MKVLLALLVALPLCDRLTLAERRSRGRELTEALRAMACDAARLDGDLREVVEDRISWGALYAMHDEEDRVALVESGMPPLFRHLNLSDEKHRLSPLASERLRRMLANRNGDPAVRSQLLLSLAETSSMHALIEGIAHDRSDPVQFTAGLIVTKNLSDEERDALADDPANVLHVAACVVSEGSSAKTLHALCGIALDPARATVERSLAVYAITGKVGECEECLAVVRELLQPKHAFSDAGTSSAYMIFESLPWEVGHELALDFDSSHVADVAQRIKLDDYVFTLRAIPDPNVVPYDFDEDR